MTPSSGLLDLDADSLWICSDLHGHWADYARVRAAFEQQAGPRDALVYLGDLIHARTREHADDSLRILSDLRLRPDPRITSLLGNHELMHIYHWHVSQAKDSDYVTAFERAMGTERETIVRWLTTLPMVVRWQNGLLHHTGASARVLRTDPVPTYPFVREWNHVEMLQRICAQSHTLESEAWQHFQPQLGQFFADTRTGRFVWDSWFSKNEQTYGARVYENLVTEMLDVYSMGHPRLNWMVTGHIPAPTGYALVGTQQLRLCSSTGSEAGQGKILRLRATANYTSASDLVAELIPLHELV